ncbi:MAG: cobalamin biosynthesis protein CbiM [Deltaproteobacteria bacterium]|nr:cobalamin biosynthesis protein CbiM [Deltaproteobacteria bacterium]
MHMADALISPAVGGAMWAASAGLIGWSARRASAGLDDRTVPLMGVIGSFVFAAQMINFTIPATGSSGHLGGGLLLAVLLGPHAAFLAMASVLAVQALLFADGGLLALGCNIFNLGFFPCFVAYPLVFAPLTRERLGRGRLLAASLLAAVLGLQLGALGVVLETVLSRTTELSLAGFLLLMQPIHLAIGVVEGLATAAVVTFLWRARPELLQVARASAVAGTGSPPGGTAGGGRPLRRVVAALLAATALLAGVASWLASTRPDGLEWSLLAAIGREEPATPAGGLHGSLSELQRRTALLPDYSLPASTEAGEQGGEARQSEEAGQSEEAEQGGATAWPNLEPGTSLAGLVGSAITMAAALAIGWLVRRRRDAA